MSLKTDGMTSNSWKHIKMQYIAAVCGIGLAIGGAVAYSGALESDASSRSDTAVAAPVPAGTASLVMPREIYYLVSSEFERARLEGVLSTDNAAGMGVVEPNLSIHILVADSPEAESQAMRILNNSIGEATEFGTFTVDFVDLRTPTISGRR